MDPFTSSSRTLSSSSQTSSPLEEAVLRKHRHDLKEASDTIRTVVQMVEEGYTFTDADARQILNELLKSAGAIDRSRELLTALVDSLSTHRAD